MLPTEYKARKALPLYTFLTQYMPDAIYELVKVAVAGNEQHSPGEPLHWAQGKSMDQLNTAMRHQFDHGQGNVYDTADIAYLANAGLPDEPGTMHLAKAAWRLLAEIQQLCNARREGIPLDKLVRGSHEFLTALDKPTGLPKVEDYAAPIAPMGTGPLTPMEFQSQLPAPTVDIPMPAVKPSLCDCGKPQHNGFCTPRGRLLTCGCFGSCKGHGARDPSGQPYLTLATSERALVDAKGFDPAD